MSVLRFEKGEQGRGVIQKQPVLNKGVFSLSGTITWFEGLMAALDCYNWVLSEQLLAPSEVFQGIYIANAVCGETVFTSFMVSTTNITPHSVRQSSLKLQV